MTRHLSRLLLWLAARLVPRVRRDEWLERWHAELWALGSGARPAPSPLRFSLGAWPDAAAECVDGWREGWSARGLTADVRDAWRAARRAPGTTALAVLVLGFGTTATATIFSLADAILLRPLPGLADPDRLVQVGRHDPARFDNFSFPNYEDLQAAVSPVADLAGYADRGVVLGTGVDARVVPAQGVTANYFRVLGVTIADGPGFDGNGTRAFLTSRVVVVSHAFWRAQADATRQHDGSLIINGAPFAVVGVAPAGFAGATTLTEPPDLWLPLGAVRTDNDGHAWIGDRGHSWIFAIGRLREGATFEAASGMIAGAHRALAESFGTTIGEGIAVEPGVGLRPGERLEAEQIASQLFAVAALVLLVAAANVAGLQFARGLARRHELAVRASLGASRRRLWRGMLVEQLLLAVGGAGLAFVLAWWTSPWLLGALPYPLAVRLDPNLRLFLFALAASTGTSTVVALWPLRRVARGSTDDSMRTRHAESSHHRAGRVLVFVEVALATVLLGCGAMLVRSSFEAARMDPGFATDAVVVTLREQPGRHAASRVDEMLTALASAPGVSAVAAGEGVPIADQSARTLTPPAAAREAGAGPQRAISTRVSADYFDLLGVTVVAGRPIAKGDRVAAETPIVMNRALADAFWPGGHALGQVWSSGPTSYRVIGIVPDLALRSLGDRGRPGMWTPLEPSRGLPRRWLVRAASPGATIVPGIRAALAPFGEDVIISRVDSLSALVGESLGPLNMATGLLAVFAAVAVLMAGLGLYSVSALQVSRQRHEFGIRLALGAAPGGVTLAVLRASCITALAGALVGVPGAVFVATSMKGWLFGVAPTDPMALLAATCATVAVSMLAAVGPARRAARTDPIRAMRGA